MFSGWVEDWRQSCASFRAVGLIQSKVEDVEPWIRRVQNSVFEASEIGIARAVGKNEKARSVELVGGR